MSSLSADPLTQLAFAVYENKGVFALLLGSGVSRAASIPTGWEITLDLIRRTALTQGVADQEDWHRWYVSTFGGEPNYSSLLEELAATPEERRSILHSYIEPDDADREAGRKVPTRAHRAIAELVRSGYIRVIVTTNFDRLMENALREVGIEPTVVASADALAGAEPITHTNCYVLKLHGDYKDARILNTDSELDVYPDGYNRTLDRILDEHGLIICGWSGEWDHALRSAFLRAPNRRYSVFWAARGKIRERAQELVGHRGARVVPADDADTFFVQINQRVKTLEQSRAQDPLSIELLVSSTKRFLSRGEHRIQLDELLARETSRVIDRIRHEDFAMPGQMDRNTFDTYVKRYESATEALACMAGAIGRWGDGGEFLLMSDILLTLSSEAEKHQSGLLVFLNLRSYPAYLVYTAYGIGLTRAARWQELHRLFSMQIERGEREPKRAVDMLLGENWKGGRKEVWNMLAGPGKDYKTPFSDYICRLYSEWSPAFAALCPDYELLFERFEFLGSLAFLEHTELEDLQSILRGQDFRWMPIGRIGWHESNAEKLLREIATVPFRTDLINAGFGNRSEPFLELSISNFRRMSSRMRW